MHAEYSKAHSALLQDAMQRDLTTARRVTLLEIIWHERYLTRPQLITRVGLKLGRACFGTSAWEDTFYRDLQVVKQALHAAGYTLRYSRRKDQPGYYLQGQPALSARLAQTLRSSVAEVDPRQIQIYRQLSPADRFHQGSVLSDTARNVVAFRIRQEQPHLTDAEAQRLALQRSYQ